MNEINKDNTARNGINPLEKNINDFLENYQKNIKRNLTEESKERIVNVLTLLVNEETYFPKDYIDFQIRGKGEQGLIFHTSKPEVVVKIPIEWTNSAGKIPENRAGSEGYLHEIFFYGLHHLQNLDKKNEFFRIPVFYPQRHINGFAETKAIIMEEVLGRSLYFFALIAYLQTNHMNSFNQRFPNGKEDYMKIKNDDDLAYLFGITDIIKTLEKDLERRKGGKIDIEYTILMEELFGVTLKEEMMNFLQKFKELGFVHEDTHPGNIMIVKNEENDTIENIYLIDFGRSAIMKDGKYGPRAMNAIKEGEASWKEKPLLLK